VRTILALALPIIGGMVSQNVLNLVDTAMVGSLGDAAIAAVGLGGFANFLATSFITGLSAGVQAMAARRVGEGRDSESALPLNGGLLLAASLAIPWSILLIYLAPTLYPYLNDDPEVIRQGVPYLQMRLVGATFLGMNFAFRGFWSGIGRSGMYLQTIVTMHVANILLNYALIFGHFGAPAMGTTGSGLATTLASCLGIVTYAVLGWRHARPRGFLRSVPAPAALRAMLRLSVPAGLQQSFFAAGYVALFWIVGRIGTAELSAANVLINVMLVAILPGLGLGIGAASLVGQALGRKEPGEALRWGWDVSRVAVVGMGLLSLPMIAIPDLLLAPFLQDPQTLALARLPLRLTGLLAGVDAIGLVLLNALLGAGDSRTVMRVSVTLQWVVFLPIAYVVGPLLGGGLVSVWVALVGYRTVQTAVLAWVWRRGAWTTLRV
jgi:putative MATE family efflux protein